MNSTRWMFRSLYGPALLILSGCMASSPYGYGTYPGYAPAPAYMPPPGSGPTPVYPSPQLGSPQMGSPSMPGHPPAWSPTPATSPGSSNGPSPTFGSPSGQGARRLEDPVPYPSDAGSRPAPPLSPRPVDRPSDKNGTPFGADGQESFDKGTQNVPKNAEEPVESFAQAGAEPFQSPLEREANAGPNGIIPASAARIAVAKTTGDPANPYNYDRASYAWLSGRVDFDPRDKCWHIMYSQTPDNKDQYGGDLTLVDHPKLKDLHDGDFVFIEGRVNSRKLDCRRKPRYEIEGPELARIGYSGKQSVGN